MKLKDLLQGETPEAQDKLDSFFSKISEEKILWYPSAGNDYRDLLEMTEHRRSLLGIDESPNIFCHTDYFYEWTQLDEGVLHDDGKTTVRVIDKIPLSIVPQANFKYFVNPNFVSFPEKALKEPKIFLLNLEVVSNQLGEFSDYVFFFVLENYNFLQEILLKHRIPVSHFVKIREGCGFGGSNESITVFYSLLGNLHTKFLLADDEIHYSKKILNEISRRFRIKPKCFELQRLNAMLSWSGFSVKVFKVIPNEGNLTQFDIDEILKEICGESKIDYV